MENQSIFTLHTLGFTVDFVRTYLNNLHISDIADTHIVFYGENKLGEHYERTLKLYANGDYFLLVNYKGNSLRFQKGEPHYTKGVKALSADDFKLIVKQFDTLLNTLKQLHSL